MDITAILMLAAAGVCFALYYSGLAAHGEERY